MIDETVKVTFVTPKEGGIYLEITVSGISKVSLSVLEPGDTADQVTPTEVCIDVKIYSAHL